MKTLFNAGWQFAKTDIGAELSDVPSLSFAPVDIPHDWLIYDSNNLYEPSFGFYRNSVQYNGAGSVRLYFEGVYMDCTVYVNGAAAAENKYGYSSFEADITEHLHSGSNEVTVLVRHNAPNSRWYSGAGIFRNVWLIETEKDYLVTDGVYFSAQRVSDGWECSVTAEVHGEGEPVISLTDSSGITLYDGVDNVFVLEDDAPVWDIDSPELLTLSVSLMRDGEIVDEITQKVGLRDINFTPDLGFYLNGRRVKLHGVCLHHDLGALGAAVNKEALRRQLTSMKNMGANAVRTSHNMPAVELMELCDEIGLLVDSEAFDMWERPKTEFDYARFFDDWYERDVASWVRRDRNHPSVIMWSVGNEIYDTHLSERGREVAAMLHAAVREHDPLCNAYTTIGSNYMPWQNAQLCAEEVDLAGYNYGESCYEKHHALHPEWRIYGSETTAGVKSRGIYHFPRETAFLTHDDLQCSSLGNCRAGAGAAMPQQIIKLDRDAEFCAGMFIWTGSDYIGEPTPYSTKNSYYGPIDTAGLQKDCYHLYRAAWTDEPVLHLFPYWDFNEGQLVDVVVYTNLPEAELFVNGRSAGMKKAESWTISWQVPYEKGEIKAVGHLPDGEEISAVRRSFGNTARLKLTPSKPFLMADGRDLLAVEICAEDENGNPVDNARDRVDISVEGARLVGFDNGDSTDYDSYKSSSRKLFGGRAVALIASSFEAGMAVVKASSLEVAGAGISFEVRAAEITAGVSCMENIPAVPPGGEIPVRKIELSRDGGALLTPDNPSVKITAKILPENATYTDLEWSTVTDSGIVTMIADVAAEGNSAVVTASAEGEFRLRCSCRNGKPQPEVISDFEFTAEGFGQPFVDPYRFVVGCFYNVALGVMNEVAEGGISLTNEHNMLGFQKVDFGRYGSERLTVRLLHWHTNAPAPFKLYCGDPRDNGRLIGEFTYQADFLWQTYQENTFTLGERLCGEQDIFFEFGQHEQRLDFGGFFFSSHKAYAKISAADSDLLHGDTFTVNGGCVEHIGNNVNIEFNDMDFAEGVSALRIYGRSHHDNDTIHISIIGENGEEVRSIAEFPFGEEYSCRQYDLADFRGKGMVRFTFLPGCDFDLEGFEFVPASGVNKNLFS